jgi:phosphatidylserine decarboxylase
VPGFLRVPLYRTWSTLTRSDLSEVLLPLRAFPSLGAFFIRHLAPGARLFDKSENVIPSPVDGTIQSIDQVKDGCILQAKGRPYTVAELLDGCGSNLDLEGGTAVTIYLAPYNYHRIHCPTDSAIKQVHWVEGSRYSVNPKVLRARERVLSINERVVLHLESDQGPYLLVLVGALNVGRIRVIGVEPGSDAPNPAPSFKRGEELARFELGSTIVLIWPAGGMAPLGEIGQPIRMGSPLLSLSN